MKPFLISKKPLKNKSVHVSLEFKNSRLQNLKHYKSSLLPPMVSSSKLNRPPGDTNTEMDSKIVLNGPCNEKHISCIKTVNADRNGQSSRQHETPGYARTGRCAQLERERLNRYLLRRIALLLRTTIAVMTPTSGERSRWCHQLLTLSMLPKQLPDSLPSHWKQLAQNPLTFWIKS